MKKITFFLFLIAGFVSYTYGQTLKIIRPGDPNYLNDSTISYSALSTTTEMVSTLYVINTGTKSVNVKVKRVKVSVLGNTTNAICWAGFCYDTTHIVSDLSYTIGAGDTAQGGDEFNGDYYPTGQIGTSTFYYIFFDSDSTNDADTITISYLTVVSGVSNITAGQLKFSAPYPNPSATSVTFGYSLSNKAQNANLKIFNMLGECVQSLPLNASADKTIVNVQSIPSGVYICELAATGCKPVYQKMIVSH